MSNYISTESRLGVGFNATNISEVGSTQGPYSVGTRIRARDTVTGGSANLGNGEFIYLLGNATEVEGSIVTFNETLGTTALVTTTAERSGAPVAVAMAAKAAGQYGWYQLQGTAKLAKGVVDFPTNSPVYRSGTTAGYVTVTAASGNQIEGMITANSASVGSLTSTILANIAFPHLQGQGT
jgi:hypothetical protein